MTKLIVKFVCMDGSTFKYDFIVKDDESAKDKIESFIYNYNKNKTSLELMCLYVYEILSSERI